MLGGMHYGQLRLCTSRLCTSARFYVLSLLALPQGRIPPPEHLLYVLEVCVHSRVLRGADTCTADASCLQPQAS